MKYILCIFFFLNCVFSQDKFIAVNQVGYLPNQIKIAIINDVVDKLYIYNEKNEKVYEGVAKLQAEKDPATGFNTYKFDFSNFNQIGTFYISDNKNLKSFSFEIKDNIFNDLTNLTVKSYYYQRCGVPLLEKYAGQFKRDICHPNDGEFHPSVGQGRLETTGGWHDAGDFGKYICPAATTVGQMLIAYENYGVKFQSDNLNIPESGNNIPDYLDEIRFELDWMFKMQRESDGALYWMINTKEYYEFMPDKCVEPRYIYEVSTMATGDFAAVMAMASRIYKKYDDAFAKKCLDAAKKAWSYLEANPTMIPAKGYRNPTDSKAGGYSMHYDNDKRLWASVELFKTTNEQKYHNYFLDNYKKNGAFDNVFGWMDKNSLAHLEYILIDDSKANLELKNILKNELISYSNKTIQQINKDGYMTSLYNHDYIWGSNGVALNKAFLLVFAYIIDKNIEYFNGALKQLNYILGVNAHNISFVSGVGTSYVMNIHHAQSFSDGIDEPIPGFIVGGPERALSDPVLKELFTKETPPAMCFVDHKESYASNEVAIYWNSGIVTIAGFFSKEKK